jgi:hypothetical protein
MTPVIFLTALGSEDDRIRGFRLGADDYLPKPFRFEELDLRVAKALGSGKEARSKAQQVAAAQPAPGSSPAGRPGAAAKPVGIHGNLEQLGLSSLLVILEMERKSGLLLVERAGATARIFARQGRVVAARIEGDLVPAESRRGAQAVYYLLTWSTGRFDFSVVDVDMEDEVQASTTNLLMEGARLIDEANR